MSQQIDAIAVTTSVEIDWVAFGQEFAQISSGDQADFLVGFGQSIESMELDGQKQLAYVSDEFTAQERVPVRRMLEALLSFMAESPPHKISLPERRDS